MLYILCDNSSKMRYTMSEKELSNAAAAVVAAAAAVPTAQRRGWVSSLVALSLAMLGHECFIKCT